MRFLVDAQLPPALARWLTARGHQAEHVFDLGRDAATDKWIWSHAAAVGAVIVTKDEDFVVLRTLDAGGPTVVWVRLGNTTNRQLFESLEPVWPAVVQALAQAEKLVEVG